LGLYSFYIMDSPRKKCLPQPLQKVYERRKHECRVLLALSFDIIIIFYGHSSVSRADDLANRNIIKYQKNCIEEKNTKEKNVSDI